jgi:hypothetical protein
MSYGYDVQIHFQVCAGLGIFHLGQVSHTPRYILYDLLSEATRKQTILIIIWWLIGIFVAIVTYKFLAAILISS